MLKILVRLYLVTIVAYAGSIFLIPELILHVFHDRYIAYNQDQARGVQRLIVNQFHLKHRDSWPQVAEALNTDFAPSASSCAGAPTWT